MRRSAFQIIRQRNCLMDRSQPSPERNDHTDHSNSNPSAARHSKTGRKIEPARAHVHFVDPAPTSLPRGLAGPLRQEGACGTRTFEGYFAWRKGEVNPRGKLAGVWLFRGCGSTARTYSEPDSLQTVRKATECDNDCCCQRKRTVESVASAARVPVL